MLSFFLVFPLAGQQEARIGGAYSTQSQLNSFLLIDQSNGASNPSLQSFLMKLAKKETSIKKEKEFLRYIFSKTHEQYLRKFVAYAPFSSMFSDGQYNCLTGTILYTIILNHFNIKHEVIETNYHIFILADTDTGKVLIEATDPFHGFVDTPLEIEERISRYRENTLYATNKKLTYYQFSFDLYNNVTLEELRGLLYYNMAVESYNQQNLTESIQYLDKATELYSSSRIDEFSQILILALRQSSLDDQRKEEHLKTIFTVRQKTSEAMALLQ